jgi:cell division protein FtsI/penicillin-binding protein 2
MRAVVTEGTGDQAAIEGVEVFGKTGTANIALPTGGYDTSNYIASFIGGAPADNPKVIILVSIRKPNRALGKGYSGGRVAAPVFKEILQKTLAYLDDR